MTNMTSISFSRPATCLVDGKEVEFGKGWDVPIELRNMRWEGGVERVDVTAPASTTDAAPKNLDETIQKEIKKSMESGKQDK